MHGGDRIAEVLEQHGVRFLFTLCGGHISPILVGAKRRGIRVVDVRDEANAVFAADAVARLSGAPGVAAVTAGPGATNTITAVKNAQLAQSPVLVLGGATGTILKNRGSLQDVDQIALFAPHVKWAKTVARVRDLAPTVERALAMACEGVPGPVFVECPVDLLYAEETVRKLYADMSGGGRATGLGGRLLAWYLGRHLHGLFRGQERPRRSVVGMPARVTAMRPPGGALRRAERLLAQAERPVLLIGSQALLDAPRAGELARAVERLAVPVYLAGMARGLLGRGHPLQLRHQRRRALREADLVLLAGVPCDFRLEYGRQIPRRVPVVAANRSRRGLRRNRRPTVGALCDPGRFVIELAERAAKPAGEAGSRERRGAWLELLRGRDGERESEIAGRAEGAGEWVNPLALCREIEATLPDDSVIVVDGGDFVATASYIVSPRAPLSWLDPGVFGTLGVGGGFALGAKLCRPDSEVWILYGDGSAAFSLAEFDTFVRHEIPVIAVVGTDGSWSQIAREQVEILGDDVGTVLRRTGYHGVADGYGGRGLLLDRTDRIPQVLAMAREIASAGQPVLINALIDPSDFRKGSISM